MVVAEHLDLDVAAGRDVALEEDGRVAEGGGRLPGGVGHRGHEVLRTGGEPHPLAAPAGGGLDQQRESDLMAGGEDGGLVGRARGQRGARHDGDPGRLHEPAGLDLGTHRLHGRRRRADPDQAGGDTGLGEGSVLGQEAPAGVDGVGSGRFGGGQDLGDVEVATDAVEGDGGVGLGHERGTGVGRGIDRNGAHAEPFRRARDAAGDLAAVGNENGGEHRRHGRADAAVRQPPWVAASFGGRAVNV